MFCRVFFSPAEEKNFSGRYRSKPAGQRLFFLRFFIMLLLSLPLNAQALPLDVEVHGVKEEEYNNIMASIKIALQQDNPSLTLRHIRRLH